MILLLKLEKTNLLDKFLELSPPLFTLKYDGETIFFHKIDNELIHLSNKKAKQISAELRTKFINGNTIIEELFIESVIPSVIASMELRDREITLYFSNAEFIRPKYFPNFWKKLKEAVEGISHTKVLEYFVDESKPNKKTIRMLLEQDFY